MKFYKTEGVYIKEGLKRLGLKKLTQYYNSNIWKSRKLKFFQNKERRCESCDSTESLEIHHGSYRGLGTEEELKFLFCLCKSCHKLVHELHGPFACSYGTLYSTTLEVIKYKDKLKKLVEEEKELEKQKIEQEEKDILKNRRESKERQEKAKKEKRKRQNEERRRQRAAKKRKQKKEGKKDRLQVPESKTKRVKQRAKQLSKGVEVSFTVEYKKK